MKEFHYKMLESANITEKEKAKMVETKWDLTQQTMQNDIDTLDSRYSKVIDRNAMAAEDVRSQAVRNLEVIASKEAEVKHFEVKMGKVHGEGLGERTEYVRHAERLQMRVQDLLMQRQYHLKDLKRRDQVEFKADERL